MGLTGLIKGRIKTIDGAIDRALQIGDEKRLREAMRHYPLAGGKRLRPVLAMIVADAVAGKGKLTIPLGVALEITHNFTLIHDDLMDKSSIRRGVQTVHKKFGDATAINAGDALFARAFEILADIKGDAAQFKELMVEFALMVRGIAEGQQMDMEFEKRGEVTEEEYLLMIEKKTALMFQTAAKGGAMVAGGTPGQVEAMSEYGRLLGLGFQIWDDLLDLKGDEKKTGKPVGGDIKNGKRTLIAVHALENLKGKPRKRFLEIFGNQKATKNEVAEAIAILEKAGSIKHAEELALEYAERAREKLMVLPESKERDILESLVDYMTERVS